MLRYNPAAFEKLEEFGDFSSIKFKCLRESTENYNDAGQTTDIKQLFDNVKCEGW